MDIVENVRARKISKLYKFAICNERVPVVPVAHIFNSMFVLRFNKTYKKGVKQKQYFDSLKVKRASVCVNCQSIVFSCTIFRVSNMRVLGQHLKISTVLPRWTCIARTTETHRILYARYTENVCSTACRMYFYIYLYFHRFRFCFDFFFRVVDQSQSSCMPTV